MLEVLEHHPEAYWRTHNNAEKDPWVMTSAFAALPELTAKKMRQLHFNGQDDEIKEYLSFLEANLRPHKVFTECVLANMLSTQSVCSTGTPLTLLNQDPETSTMYKRHLAEFLGIPTGKRLRQLQQAYRNTREAIDLFSEFDI